MTVKSAARMRCFFDLELDGMSLGRIILELFNDVCPRTAENFRALCTGEKGLGQRTQKPLHYQGVKLHRVVRDFMIQGGDFSAGNGTGGESVYGGTFDDENFELHHDRPFLLSMANRGKNTNGSQFFLTTQPAPHLDGVHVVFGHVVSGQEVVAQVEAVPTDNKSRPLQDLRVARCGQLVLQAKHRDKKKRKKRDRSASSDEEKGKKKKKKDKKDKKYKKTKTDAQEVGKPEDDVGEPAGKEHPLVTTTNIDPDEIPTVPENRFLGRGGEGRDQGESSRGRRASPSRDRHSASHRSRERPPPRTEIRAGKRFKGRGFLRYDPEMTRSRSRTPPHWRLAQKRTMKLSQFERLKERESRRAEELRAREEQRQRRHLQQQQSRQLRHKEPQQRTRLKSDRGGASGAEGKGTSGWTDQERSTEQADTTAGEQHNGAPVHSEGGGGEEADVEDIHERLDYEEAGGDERAAADDDAESADEDDAGRRLLRLIQERQKRRIQGEEPQAGTVLSGDGDGEGTVGWSGENNSPASGEADRDFDPRRSRSADGQRRRRRLSLHSCDKRSHSPRKRSGSHDKNARSGTERSKSQEIQDSSRDSHSRLPEKATASDHKEPELPAKVGAFRTRGRSRGKRSSSRTKRSSSRRRSDTQTHRSRSRGRRSRSYLGYRRRSRSRDRGSRRSRDRPSRLRRSRSRDRRSRSRGRRSHSRDRRSRSRDHYRRHRRR